MKVQFVEACTVYPDGEKPVEAIEGQTLDVAGAYGALLIEKGHAVASTEADQAPTRKGKGKAADNASA